MIDIKNQEGLKFLSAVSSNSVDLILTDPPYIISKESGMNKLYKRLKGSKEPKPKTEKEWEAYRKKNNIKDTREYKRKYMKYGTIYGTKYCVRTDYGDWDSNFTMKELEEFIKEYYRTLRQGGTLIIFFDLWKIGEVKSMLEKHKFKQIRLIEWLKTNPQPRNSKLNYLTNSREVALVGIKGKNPTFHSEYDNGVYRYPSQGDERCHPTQKSLLLFEELIRKHTNEGDLVMDTFLGSGTTALASKRTKRMFIGTEKSKHYYKEIQKRLEKQKD
jgi:site-specific DNA-methyltransferase (adenine-specific)